jgi:hypothetical protein
MVNNTETKPIISTIEKNNDLNEKDYISKNIIHPSSLNIPPNDFKSKIPTAEKKNYLFENIYDSKKTTYSNPISSPVLEFKKFLLYFLGASVSLIVFMFLIFLVTTPNSINQSKIDINDNNIVSTQTNEINQGATIVPTSVRHKNIKRIR